MTVDTLIDALKAIPQNGPVRREVVVVHARTITKAKTYPQGLAPPRSAVRKVVGYAVSESRVYLLTDVTQP